MSFVTHAKKEMELAGLYDRNADYDGNIPEAVMALVEAHSKWGHSGGSHYVTLEIFNKLINYKTLTPINSDPTTWVEVSQGLWQSNRQGTCFSENGGQTWYDIDDPEKKNFPKHLL